MFTSHPTCQNLSKSRCAHIDWRNSCQSSRTCQTVRLTSKSRREPTTENLAYYFSGGGELPSGLKQRIIITTKRYLCVCVCNQGRVCIFSQMRSSGFCQLKNFLFFLILPILQIITKGVRKGIETRVKFPIFTFPMFTMLSPPPSIFIGGFHPCSLWPMQLEHKLDWHGGFPTPIHHTQIWCEKSFRGIWRPGEIISLSHRSIKQVFHCEFLSLQDQMLTPLPPSILTL